MQKNMISFATHIEIQLLTHTCMELGFTYYS